MVQGQHIEFLSIPFQKEPQEQSFKQFEIVGISTEVEKRLHKGVIIATRHGKGEFRPPILLRPKRDGSFRLILRSAINMMRPNCYMASVVLKMGMNEWMCQFYKFTCFPNGLALCPRKFTKL